MCQSGIPPCSGNRHYSAYCHCWLSPYVPSEFNRAVAGNRHYSAGTTEGPLPYYVSRRASARHTVLRGARFYCYRVVQQCSMPSSTIFSRKRATSSGFRKVYAALVSRDSSDTRMPTPSWVPISPFSAAKAFWSSVLKKSRGRIGPIVRREREAGEKEGGGWCSVYPCEMERTRETEGRSGQGGGSVGGANRVMYRRWTYHVMVNPRRRNRQAISRLLPWKATLHRQQVTPAQGYRRTKYLKRSSPDKLRQETA